MSVLKVYYLAYKDNNGFFGLSGGQRSISCNHQKIGGDWWINNAGEVISFEDSTSPINGGYNYVDKGDVTVSGNRFSDSNFKKVYKIHDYETSIDTYVDAASYDANIVNCNPVSYPSICGVPSGIATSVLGTTTATIVWTAGTNATGYEFVNQATPGIAPTINGTFTSSISVALTGLTTAHAYRFWIRTICGAGYKSAWVSFNFTTS